MKRFGFTASACAALLLAAAPSRAAEPAFRLTSPLSEDNGVMPKKFGGVSAANKNCRGENISPPLAWTPGPAGTKSYAIMMVDMAGRLGTGVDHWIAYGVPANVTSLDEGAVSKPQSFFTGGTNSNDTQVYFGPCPGPGTGLHHYVFTLVATDIEPGELKPGLTRADLLKSIPGRGKAVTDLVLRMAYPE